MTWCSTRINAYAPTIHNLSEIWLKGPNIVKFTDDSELSAIMNWETKVKRFQRNVSRQEHDSYV